MGEKKICVKMLVMLDPHENCGVFGWLVGCSTQMTVLNSLSNYQWTFGLNL